jgi:replicative DNA helicase
MKISHEESKYLIKKLDDTLEFGYVVTVKDVMRQILDNIDNGDFKSYKAVQEDLYNISTAIINIKRNALSMGSDQTFSLQEEIFDTVVADALQRLKDRNRIFLTGVQMWNTILSPGYMSKRLYTYLAFPGKGKSTILLKSALDIRRYNKGIVTKDQDKRPAVLFLTLENDIAETVERIYNMTVDTDDIRNYSEKQIKKKLKKDGHLELTSDDNIDIIIKEYRNRELDTNDLYGIINDLADEGVEVITLIVDYMKRIRPAERASDEKGELKNISNELKELAKFFDIPVNKIAA